MAEEKEPLEIESQGYKAGYNPMWGEFNHTFDFVPVPYSGGKSKRHKFIKQVQRGLAQVKFVYFGEVKLDIILYFDEQKRLETPELADLDNYAKLLCDALKGPHGLLIDDTQIQSLSISWIDTPIHHYFTIRLNGHPDEYIMKPLPLYEMPNHLFYPVSPNSWTKEGIKQNTSEQRKLLLAILHSEIESSRNFKQMLLKKSQQRLGAFWDSQGLKPILAGFHKSRIIESGFSLYNLEEWTANEAFKKAIAKIDQLKGKLEGAKPLH